MEESAGRPLIIEAKPEPITVNSAETAVIVVDMQNDFCSKGGMFDRAGINLLAVQKAVATTRKVLLAAREAGIKIVYLNMGFRADLSDIGDTGSANRVRHLQLGVVSPLYLQFEIFEFADEVKSHSPHYGLVIALHSPR